MTPGEKAIELIDRAGARIGGGRLPPELPRPDVLRVGERYFRLGQDGFFHEACGLNVTPWCKLFPRCEQPPTISIEDAARRVC